MTVIGSQGNGAVAVTSHQGGSHYGIEQLLHQWAHVCPVAAAAGCDGLMVTVNARSTPSP